MELIIGLVILIFSAIFHEVSHGFIADRLGDPTARLSGRLTLNPLPHIDPIMSIIFPLILIKLGSPVVFGAAKPVPIDPYNFKDKKKDMALVALAGPSANLGLALVAALIYRILLLILVPGVLQVVILGFLFYVVYYNLLLAIFNLIPIPPLDGSKILAFLLPEKEAAVYLSLGSIGMFIIFFLLLFPFGGFSLGSLIFSLLGFARHILLP